MTQLFQAIGRFSLLFLLSAVALRPVMVFASTDIDHPVPLALHTHLDLHSPSTSASVRFTRTHREHIHFKVMPKETKTFQASTPQPVKLTFMPPMVHDAVAHSEAPRFTPSQFVVLRI